MDEVHSRSQRLSVGISPLQAFDKLIHIIYVFSTNDTVRILREFSPESAMTCILCFWFPGYSTASTRGMAARTSDKPVPSNLSGLVDVIEEGMSENVSETPVRAKCGIGQDFDAKPTKSVGDYKTCLRCVRPQQRSPRCSNTPRRILEIGEVSEAHEKDRSIYVFATVSKRSKGLVSIHSGSASP